MSVLRGRGDCLSWLKMSRVEQHHPHVLEWLRAPRPLYPRGSPRTPLSDICCLIVSCLACPFCWTWGLRTRNHSSLICRVPPRAAQWYLGRPVRNCSFYGTSISHTAISWPVISSVGQCSGETDFSRPEMFSLTIQSWISECLRCLCVS